MAAVYGYMGNHTTTELQKGAPSLKTNLLPKIEKKDVRVVKNENPILSEPRLSLEDIEIINEVVSMKDLAEVEYRHDEPDGTNYSNRCSSSEKARMT